MFNYLIYINIFNNIYRLLGWSGNVELDWRHREDEQKTRVKRLERGKWTDSNGNWRNKEGKGSEWLDVGGRSGVVLFRRIFKKEEEEGRIEVGGGIVEEGRRESELVGVDSGEGFRGTMDVIEEIVESITILILDTFHSQLEHYHLQHS